VEVAQIGDIGGAKLINLIITKASKMNAIEVYRRKTDDKSKNAGYRQTHKNAE